MMNGLKAFFLMSVMFIFQSATAVGPCSGTRCTDDYSRLEDREKNYEKLGIKSIQEKSCVGIRSSENIFLVAKRVDDQIVLLEVTPSEMEEVCPFYFTPSEVGTFYSNFTRTETYSPSMDLVEKIDELRVHSRAGSLRQANAVMRKALDELLVKIEEFIVKNR